MPLRALCRRSESSHVASAPVRVRTAAGHDLQLHGDEHVIEVLRGFGGPLGELLDRIVQLALERHERRKRARVLEANEYGAGSHPQEVDTVGSLAERGLGHEHGEPLLAAGGIAPRNGNDPAVERDREAPWRVRAA